MKLTLKEFTDQLTLAKSLPAEARAAMIANLKTATVVEVDADGKETPVAVEIIETPPAAVVEEPKPEAKSVKVEIEKAIADADADAVTKGRKVPAVIEVKGSAFSIPANVKRVGHLKSFKRADVNGKSAEERAYRFGMWTLAALGNENAKRFCNEQGITIKLHSGGNNATGGVLIPDEFGTDLIDLREQYGVVRRLFKIRPMASDTRSDPRRASGLTAYFTGDGAAGTESTKSWDKVQLVAKKLTVISRMTNELSEDSVINIGDDLAQEISYAFALKEDQCGFIGDGSATYGGISGVNNRLVAVNGVDDGGGLVLASGNLFSEFTLADFNKVVGRLPQYAANSAKWVTHRSFYYGTMQRLELAAGGVSAAEVREGNRVPTFLGYPVELSQVMPSADANSQVAALLGDFSLAASFGDRRQETISFSDSASVGGESTFERDEIAIRGTERFDINVHDVGSATEAGPVVGLISAAS